MAVSRRSRAPKSIAMRLTWVWNSWWIGGGIEPRRFSLRYDNVLFGSDVETNRPVDHRRIPDVDVFIDSDTDLRIAADVARAGIQSAPDITRSRLAHFDHAKGLAAAADLVMDRDIEDCRHCHCRSGDICKSLFQFPCA